MQRYKDVLKSKAIYDIIKSKTAYSFWSFGINPNIPNEFYISECQSSFTVTPCFVTQRLIMFVITWFGFLTSILMRSDAESLKSPYSAQLKTLYHMSQICYINASAFIVLERAEHNLQPQLLLFLLSMWAHSISVILLEGIMRWFPLPLPRYTNAVFVDKKCLFFSLTHYLRYIRQKNLPLEDLPRHPLIVRLTWLCQVCTYDVALAMLVIRTAYFDIYENKWEVITTLESLIVLTFDLFIVGNYVRPFHVIYPLIIYVFGCITLEITSRANPEGLKRDSWVLMLSLMVIFFGHFLLVFLKCVEKQIFWSKVQMRMEIFAKERMIASMEKLP